MWFFVFWGVSLVRKIKRKLTEFLERSYRNSRFSWYRTILFWAGFVWVGSCTGRVEWELNQQSRVWGALVWGSSGAGSWELKGLLILFRDFLQIVSGDTVQGYYQTLSYIYTFCVWCFFGQVEKIDLGYLLWTYLWPNSFIYLHLSIIIKSAGVGELRGLLILFRFFLRIVSGDTVQGYYQTFSYIYTFCVWCFLVRLKKLILDFLWSYWWPNSFIYLHLSIIIKTETRFIFGQDFITLKKKEGILQ